MVIWPIEIEDKFYYGFAICGDASRGFYVYIPSNSELSKGIEILWPRFKTPQEAYQNFLENYEERE